VLQRDLAIAISEFDPTSKFVANKREWASYALKLVAEREWPRRSKQKCSRHNMFVQWEFAHHRLKRGPVLTYLEEITRGFYTKILVLNNESS
jgi:hypothetical protein